MNAADIIILLIVVVAMVFAARKAAGHSLSLVLMLFFISPSGMPEALHQVLLF